MMCAAIPVLDAAVRPTSVSSGSPMAVLGSLRSSDRWRYATAPEGEIRG
jgi:hypothetical protein